MIENPSGNSERGGEVRAECSSVEIAGSTSSSTSHGPMVCGLLPQQLAGLNTSDVRGSVARQVLQLRSADPLLSVRLQQRRPFMIRLWPTLLGLCALTIPPARAQEPRMPPHIAVPSVATAEVTPDIAVLRLGVATERRTAAEAAAANARAAQEVIDEGSALGVEGRDARTLSVTLIPLYSDERDPNGRGGRRILTGYLARNTLQIRVRDVAKAGAIARALVDKGANVLEG